MALIIGCLVLTVWVQRHALGAFFSSPDDLVHLQQAVGLRPIPPSPFRFLSQVLYFRVMVWLFGLGPGPFHLATLLVHLLNVALLFLFVRLFGASRPVAGLCACLTGTFPLFFPLLASAVGMNDELALTFMLISLHLVRIGGTLPILGASGSFVVALLCKESVLTMPFIALAIGGPDRRRIARVLPLLAITVVFAALLLVVPPQGLGPYAARFGTNVFHNLMTYAAWSVNLVQPMPDLVSSYDPSAWRVGVWAYGALLASWLLLRRNRPLIGLGMVWWLAALLPVLLLRFQTYRHYLYPALPGMALVVAVIVTTGVASLLRRESATDAPPSAWHRRSSGLVVGILVACAVAYAVRAERLIVARVLARVPGTELALDPVVRRQEVAYRALASLAPYLESGHARRVAIFSPAGVGRVFGARTGREYRLAPRKGRPYDLLEASLDGGNAVRLFFPSVDTVAFIDRWTPEHLAYDLFLPHQWGSLVGVGTGPTALETTSRWMLEQGWYPQACDFLETVLKVYPTNSALRLDYAYALLKSGQSHPGGANGSEEQDF